MSFEFLEENQYQKSPGRVQSVSQNAMAATLLRKGIVRTERSANALLLCLGVAMLLAGAFIAYRTFVPETDTIKKGTNFSNPIYRPVQ